MGWIIAAVLAWIVVYGASLILGLRAAALVARIERRDDGQ